jgi:hypothetical protein
VSFDGLPLRRYVPILFFLGTGVNDDRECRCARSFFAHSLLRPLTETPEISTA